MWALRRITGRPLGERPFEDDPDGDVAADAPVEAGSAAATRLDALLRPAPLGPARFVTSRRPAQAHLVVRAADAEALARRAERRRPGDFVPTPRVVVLAALTAVVLIGIAGVNIAPPPADPDGRVLGLVGTPAGTSNPSVSGIVDVPSGRPTESASTAPT